MCGKMLNQRLIRGLVSQQFVSTKQNCVSTFFHTGSLSRLEEGKKDFCPFSFLYGQARAGVTEAA